MAGKRQQRTQEESKEKPALVTDEGGPVITGTDTEGGGGEEGRGREGVAEEEGEVEAVVASLEVLLCA